MQERLMSTFELLNEMRAHGGPAITAGLNDEVLSQFVERDERLTAVVREAHTAFRQLLEDEPELLMMDEASQIKEIQCGYVNFYADDAINPYVALVGNGPWIISLKGAVMYDTGGYGMLGFGHSPENVLKSMNRRHVMANIMSPNLSQKYLVELLRKEIGHTRGACPFDKFLCVNSGSEAVTVGARLSDINAKLLTDPGGRYANKTSRILSLKDSFHGRTHRPAQFSDSTRENYSKHLASFRDNDNLITVEPNDIEQLKQVFRWAEKNNYFFEAFFFEPVMGEGNPGLGITPEFYAEARRLTREHGALMLVDSIQAGLRAHGVLSIVDYPGFESQEEPDMETYSKALNAGQYPLSVLAMNKRTADLYKKGVYGNTMTSNPRALDVACAVLEGITPEIRRNIVERGAELVAKLKVMQDELGGRITQVQGTGLLLSVELDSQRYKSYGAESTEEYMRFNGLNVIHGGVNSLRFTPNFDMSSEETDLIVEATRQALLHGPVKATADEAAAA
jgi:acetylornithine/succinyldiaminopimelate/putrescine aminotransferase